MKVLMCHNYYQRRGGEDEVFEIEAGLLKSNGHEVVVHTVHNDSINRHNHLKTGLGAIWNQRAYQRVKSLVQIEQPDLVHFYNTFPVLSPAVYYAAKSTKLPVVQSLHNYRLLCLNAAFYRAAKPCEDCLGRFLPLPGIVHGCFHDSRMQSSSVAAMLVVHRLLATWHKKVDLFLLGTTESARQKFISAGIPPEKLMLKPNFVHPDPGVGSGNGGYVIFVGRFDEEKGIQDLLTAWERLNVMIPLKIVGDGPLAPLVKLAVQRLRNIEWCGRTSLQEMYALMKEAVFLVFPSRWYEAMPRTIVDSFAVGTPVIASDTGAMSDMIDDGKSGLLFKPGDANDLAEKARRLFERPELLNEMRGHARQEYENNFTAEGNYGLIMDAYQLAAGRNSG